MPITFKVLRRRARGLIRDGSIHVLALGECYIEFWWAKKIGGYGILFFSARVNPYDSYS